MFSLVSLETPFRAHVLLFVAPCTDSMEKERKRVVIGEEGRKLVANVYRFLKSEHELTKLYHDPKCDLSHLRHITKRTAEATGISLRTVQKILQDEKEFKVIEECVKQDTEETKKDETKRDEKERKDTEDKQKRKIEGDEEENETRKRVKEKSESEEVTEESSDSDEFNVQE